MSGIKAPSEFFLVGFIDDLLCVFTYLVCGSLCVCGRFYMEPSYTGLGPILMIVFYISFPIKYSVFIYSHSLKYWRCRFFLGIL